MSENFVRKTLNVEDITKKETYTLHDLDLVETKDGHVFIRIFKKNAQPDGTDHNAYLYELTNAVRTINKMALVESEQLNNTSMLPLPLVMELQYLPDSVKLTMVGDTTATYKVNGVAGTFENEKTAYIIPLEGEVLPDITVKRGNKVIDVYKLHQADLHQTNPLHPEYVKGAKECCDRLAAVEHRLDGMIAPAIQLVQRDLSVELNIMTDQPDDPIFTPTRPACLDDIKVFYGSSDNVTEATLEWESYCIGHQQKPGSDQQSPTFSHVFYSWIAQIQLTESGYVWVEQNGVIVATVHAEISGGGDIS